MQFIMNEKHYHLNDSLLHLRLREFVVYGGAPTAKKSVMSLSSLTSDFLRPLGVQVKRIDRPSEFFVRKAVVISTRDTTAIALY